LKNSRSVIAIRVVFGLAHLLLIALGVVILKDDPRFQSARFLTTALTTIEENICEPADPERMFASAWLGMNDILDPYTIFIPARSYQFVDEENRGSFEGIGVEITVRDGFVTVISPMAGSNAEEVGLRSGDQVITVDSTDVEGMSADEVTSMIRGPAGSTVLLGIKRPGYAKSFEVRVERRQVDLSSISYSGVVDSIGYIHLNRFSLTTPVEINEALDRLTRNGISGLALDLRGNPGGFMSAAVYLAQIFLPADKLILATKSRRGWENYAINSVDDGPLIGLPLVVLVDRGSASASEIVAGVLQDYDRAVIIGDTTYGKGLVQTNLMLEGGNAFRITTSKYYLPSGRLVQRFADKDWAKYLNVSRSELNTAFRTEGGRSVYGGGGVAPDVEVPPDSINLLAASLSYGSYFFKFTVDYRAAHGDSIPVEVDDKILEDFRKYVMAQGFEAPNYMLDRVTVLEEQLADLNPDALAPILARMKERAETLDGIEWAEAKMYIAERLRERLADQRGGVEEVYSSSRLRYDRRIKSAFEILSDMNLYESLLKEH